MHEIFEGGVAAADGRLKVGDQILEVIVAFNVNNLFLFDHLLSVGVTCIK